MESTFSTRIEALLKELVDKTNQETLVQWKGEIGDQIGPLEVRLGRLERRFDAMERLRTTSLSLLTQMLDEMKATALANAEDDAPSRGRSAPEDSSQPEPEHESVTITDVQRFLMQRLPNDRA